MSNAPRSTVAAAGLAPDLRAWVEAATGATVTAAEPIGRGASRRIWAIDLDAGDPLVVREDTGTGPVAGTPLTLEREAAVYRALAGTDLRIPALRSVSPDGRALLLDRARGVEHFESTDAGQRSAVMADYGRQLARLHQLDVDDLDLGPVGVDGATSPTAADVDLWHAIQVSRCGSTASPEVPLALRWLGATVPDTSRHALCHGDAGPGNFLHEDGRVTAILDWEFAHVGDPHDDLAWIAVRNQVLRRPIDASIAYGSWRDETGDVIELDRLEWFRALVLTRMLVSCDATIAWAGDDLRAARVQVVLRPYLAVAVLEALRRSGCTDPVIDDLAITAHRDWEGSDVAALLGDPTDLDDLGALLDP